MKIRVVRCDGQSLSVLSLPKPFRRIIGQLAFDADKILDCQDPELWARAGDPAFLGHLRKGADVLREISLHGWDTLHLSDDAAHLAFITCTLLANQAITFPVPLRQGIGSVLLLLAECCPVDIRVAVLPPFNVIAAPLRQNPSFAKHYRELLAAARRRNSACHTITIADALRLLAVLRTAPSCDLLSLFSELHRVTEGLRTALLKVKKSQA